MGSLKGRGFGLRRLRALLSGCRCCSCFDIDCVLARDGKRSGTTVISAMRIIAPLWRWVVFSKDHLETVSTSTENSAAQDFYLQKGFRGKSRCTPFCTRSSYCHPVRRAPYSLSVTRNRIITKRLETIKLRSHGSMLRQTAGTQSLRIMSKLVRTDCERLYAGSSPMVAQRADVPLATPQP